MSVTELEITEYDVVELLDSVAQWPAGTLGTVISERGRWKLVEISEEEPPGAMLDMLSVHESQLNLVAKH